MMPAWAGIARTPEATAIDMAPYLASRLSIEEESCFDISYPLILDQGGGWHAVGGIAFEMIVAVGNQVAPRDGCQTRGVVRDGDIGEADCSAGCGDIHARGAVRDGVGIERPNRGVGQVDTSNILG